MERWTYLIIAGADGAPTQVRATLRAGADPTGWPTRQIRVDGTTVRVDAAVHDYEAPEWKVAQILDAGMGGGGAARLDALKHELRVGASA
jgi:hypothetical protein